MVRSTMIAASAALASSTMGVQFVMYTPGSDSDAVERMDSIISPGTIAAHTHQIFGANKASPDQTYESLQQSDCTTVGNAGGDGNAADLSVYWHPSLYAEAKDGSGYIRIPTNGHKLYYRDVGNAGDKKADPFEFPKNFHMIAGDQRRRSCNDDASHAKITEWICHSSGGQIDGVENKSGLPSNIQNCDSYPGLAGSVHFPHCWNGKEPSASDPNDHMSYPEGDVQAGPCPSSHPIRVPHIFMENFFDLNKVYDKIKPNTFALSQGDPTGFGLHADFVNGWDEGAIPELFDTCPQPYYGNSDVGTCPSFKKFSTKNTQCKLPVAFEEESDRPGQYLPGCNPVSTTNPAPKFAPAELGVCSNDCKPAGSKAPSHDSSSNAPAAPGYGSSAPKVAPAPSYKAPTTTLATAYSAPEASPAAYANKIVDNAQDQGNDNIEYVTEIVTVTAYKRDAAPTNAAKFRREHLGHHKRHNHKA